MRLKVQGHTKARLKHQKEVVLPLAEKYVGRGMACVLRSKSCHRTNLEHEDKLDSFNAAASSKICDCKVIWVSNACSFLHCTELLKRSAISFILYLPF